MMVISPTSPTFDFPLSQGHRSCGVYMHPQLGSTQTEVGYMLEKGCQAPFVVMAESQTQGRGQWDRSWHSPTGHFYGSIALHAASWPHERGHAALVGGVAVLETIQNLALETSGVTLDLALKWPNDVLIQGRKVSGILCEVYNTHHMIMGIGVNLAPLSEGHPPQATSLDVYGVSCTPRKFIERLLPRLDQGWHQWLTQGPATVLDAYQRWGTVPLQNSIADS